MKLLRSFVSLLGRGLLGGAVLCFLVALMLCALGAYCVAVPAARVSRRHGQLIALVRVAQALAVLGAAWRAGEPARSELDET